MRKNTPVSLLSMQRPKAIADRYLCPLKYARKASSPNRMGGPSRRSSEVCTKKMFSKPSIEAAKSAFSLEKKTLESSYMTQTETTPITAYGILQPKELFPKTLIPSAPQTLPKKGCSRFEGTPFRRSWAAGT